MTPRKQRLAWLLAGLAVLALITFFVVNALRDNMVFFHTPTEVLSGGVGEGKYIRIGGMVVPDSVRKQADGVSVRFEITDTNAQLPVTYRGILPDLFKEGKGAVAQGAWNGTVFIATEVLAKHDENYMPPEAQQALDKGAGAYSAVHKDR